MPYRPLTTPARQKNPMYLFNWFNIFLNILKTKKFWVFLGFGSGLMWTIKSGPLLINLKNVMINFALNLIEHSIFTVICLVRFLRTDIWIGNSSKYPFSVFDHAYGLHSSLVYYINLKSCLYIYCQIIKFAWHVSISNIFFQAQKFREWSIIQENDSKISFLEFSAGSMTTTFGIRFHLF